MADNRTEALERAVNKINAEEASIKALGWENREHHDKDMAAYNAKEVAKNDAIGRMTDILAEHGIKMEVAACGCCDSPWVTFVYKDEYILGDEKYGQDGASFDMVNRPYVR